jgi:hypothetical protein
VRNKKSITKRENSAPPKRKGLIGKTNITLIAIRTKNTPIMNAYRIKMWQMISKK